MPSSFRTHIRRPFQVGLATLVAFAFGNCGGERATPVASVISGNDNPLLAEWHTPFGVPPFDLIANEHYLPAFREAMARHKADQASAL